MTLKYSSKIISKITIILIVVLIIINFAVWERVYFAYNKNYLFEVVFLDVGQGDSLLIKTPNSKIGIIDAGKNEKVLYSLEKELRNFQNTIDFAILTHADLDHYGGFFEIIKKYKINNFVINKSIKSTAEFINFLEKIKKLKIKTYSVYMDSYILIDGVLIDFLWPENIFPIYGSSNENESSISAFIRYKNFSIFSGGDLDKANENLIIDRDCDKTQCKIDITKLGHHGSKTSTSKEFLESLSPLLAIISVGKNNIYKHPSDEVLKILNDLEIKYLRTDEQGNIKITSNGLGFFIK